MGLTSRGNIELELERECLDLKGLGIISSGYCGLGNGTWTRISRSKGGAYIAWWSTIAAQLPGRTDNEIKNYWNTHLKKRLLRMGIDPDTFAPSSSPSSSSSAAAAAAPASSFPTTRHMAQWESARLEAEARLSRESLLFSSSAAAAAASAASVGARNESDSPPHSNAEPDFFLRMWNSEIGDAFRKPVSGDSSIADAAVKVETPAREETESKSCVSVAAAAAAAVGGGGTTRRGRMRWRRRRRRRRTTCTWTSAGTTWACSVATSGASRSSAATSRRRRWTRHSNDRLTLITSFLLFALAHSRKKT
uniref:Uncharacterized protein n=1 Tax=Ananas comosus var. bracteatus TaxID=296719 RepID=A0A6V7QNC7_ANACO|nr:unnamed protein product [Ananas comosus var. bracteatus]